MAVLKHWNDMNEYDGHYEGVECDEHDEVVDLVETDTHYAADLTTNCKSYKVALNRFFKALAGAGITDYQGWKDCLIESVQRGYMGDKSTVWEDGKSVYTGDYAWSVEEVNDGVWYIFLNIRKAS